MAASAHGYTPRPPHRAREPHASSGSGTAGDVARARTLGGEQQLPVDAAVLLRVLHPDRCEPLADGPDTLVGRQDALARRADRVLWWTAGRYGGTQECGQPCARRARRKIGRGTPRAVSASGRGSLTAVAMSSAANGVTDFDSSAMVYGSHRTAREECPCSGWGERAAAVVWCRAAVLSRQQDRASAEVFYFATACFATRTFSSPVASLKWRKILFKCSIISFVPDQHAGGGVHRFIFSQFPLQCRARAPQPRATAPQPITGPPWLAGARPHHSLASSHPPGVSPSPHLPMCVHFTDHHEHTPQCWCPVRCVRPAGVRGMWATVCRTARTRAACRSHLPHSPRPTLDHAVLVCCTCDHVLCHVRAGVAVYPHCGSER